MRPGLEDFARAMEKRLSNTNCEEGWGKESPQWILDTLQGEVTELRVILHDFENPIKGGPPIWREDVKLAMLARAIDTAVLAYKLMDNLVRPEGI